MGEGLWHGATWIDLYTGSLNTDPTDLAWSLPTNELNTGSPTGNDSKYGNSELSERSYWLFIWN